MSQYRQNSVHFFHAEDTHRASTGFKDSRMAYRMKVGLFIPCYMDQFYPDAARAALRLLESVGCQVAYPPGQTCCGQPLANSGLEQEAIPIYRHFVEVFSGYDHVVAPSASCVYHVCHHYNVLPSSEELETLRARTYDISTFLVDVLQVQHLEAHFPHKVGLHQSCHGLRGLRSAKSTELVGPAFSKWEQLLQMVHGIELIELDRRDECCGFGGTFSINEPDVSAKMGIDRIDDHVRHGAAYITSGDMSCLMHLDGLIRRRDLPVQVKHLVEILAPAG